MRRQTWHSAIQHYLITVAGLNLIWEIVQLPLYTLWRTGSIQSIAIAILHCTIGDMVIAITALISALLFLAADNWPAHRQLRVAFLAIAIGLIYTIYSERFNIGRGAWAYTELMPILPWLNVGLTPVLQWLVIPSIGFWVVEKISRTNHINPLP